MAESKVLTTYTLIAASVPSVDVSTYYQDTTFGDILIVFINDTYKILNGSPLSEGHGIVVGSDNFLTDIYLEVDITGDLVVFGDDANKYSIDSDGNLIITI